MAVRVYVPTTSSGLAHLVTEGRIPGPVRAHAVTDALRADWVDGDQEEWEYAALGAAARSSAAMREAADRPRRYVVAADVDAVAPAADDDPTRVEVPADVVWRQVASAHVDTRDDAPEDDDLAWFARQELGDLLRR